MGPADAIVPAASAPGRSRRVWCYGLLAAVWIGLDAWLLPALVSDAATLAVARPASNLLFVVVSLLLLLKWLPGTAARQRPVDEPAHALAPSARDERAPDELRRLLERIEDGVVALDSQWVYTYLNSQAARMLGRDSPQDLIGRHIWTEFPDGVGQPFHLAYEQAMSSQKPVTVEEHSARWERWFENRIFPSTDGLTIYFTDITARKRAELVLQDRERDFRLLAEQVPAIIYRATLDGHGTTLYVNQRIAVFGTTPEQWLADRSNWRRVMHPDDIPRVLAEMADGLAQGDEVHTEFRMRDAEGHWRHFSDTACRVQPDNGGAPFLQGVTMDVTKQVRTMQALRETEAYRRSLFERLSDGVLLFDGEMRILDANPRLLAMFGRTRDELLRLRVHDLLHTSEHERLQRSLPEMGSLQPHLAEWDHVAADGRRFPVEVSAGPLADDRYLAVLRDITARRRIEGTLMAYQIELSELTQRLLLQEQQTTRRIAQSLHDRLGQTLAAARLNLDAAIAGQRASMPPQVQMQCGRISGLLDQAVQEVRLVLADLRPPLLEEQGLAAALDNEIGGRAPAALDVDVLLEAATDTPPLRWPADVEYGAFMIAREAIANACQHARAVLIRVVVEGDERRLELDVVDDGIGIAEPVMQGRPGHLGIVGMRERAIAIGGRLVVDRDPAGGTRVQLRWELQG